MCCFQKSLLSKKNSFFGSFSQIQNNTKKKPEQNGDDNEEEWAKVRNKTQDHGYKQNGGTWV